MSVTSTTSTSLQPRPVIDSRRTGSASAGAALRNQAAPMATPARPAAARSATSTRRRGRLALAPRPARRRSVVRPIAGSPKRLVDLEAGVRDVVEALVRVLAETAAQQSANRSRHWRGQAVPGWFLVHDRREHVGHGLPCERSLARQQLEEERPEGPDVRPLVHPPAARLLGGHVARGPEDHSRLGARLRQRRRLRQVRRGARGRVPRVGLGQAEVEDLDLAVRRQLDVGGLEVAVDDALLVRFLERLRDLPRDLRAPRRRESVRASAAPRGPRPRRAPSTRKWTAEPSASVALSKP